MVQHGDRFYKVINLSFYASATKKAQPKWSPSTSSGLTTHATLKMQ